MTCTHCGAPIRWMQTDCEYCGCSVDSLYPNCIEEEELYADNRLVETLYRNRLSELNEKHAKLEAMLAAQLNFTKCKVWEEIK